MNISKTTALKLITILLLISILFSSCAGSKGKGISLRSDIINAENAGKDYHTSDNKNYKVITSSGLIIMYFDKATMSVGIKDTVSNVFWSSIPQSSVSKSLQYAPLSLIICDSKGRRYNLNTQDNSVAVEGAKYLVGESGVTVTYNLKSKDENVSAECVLRYTLADGSFYVNFSMNSVDIADNLYLEEVRLLNDFGSFEKSGKEDFIFVPDGCGALIKTGVKATSFTPISLKVYGNDLAVDRSGDASPCIFGAYGMKRGDGAFLCTIQNGAEIATINAYRNSKSCLNSVGAIFSTCDRVITDKKVTFGNKYKQEIDLCYRFLSGKSATYSGLASACRETLIRNSTLSSRSLSISEQNMPLMLSLQAGYVSANGRYEVKSDFEQALSLLTLLKAKGVNNILLRYNGLSKKANNGNTLFADFYKGLGKEKEYDELYNYISTQQFSLFLETDILSSAKLKSVAKDIKGDKIVYSSDAAKLLNSPLKKQRLLKMKAIEKSIDDILDRSFIDFDGYALNDMGTYLYSDYSSDLYTRSSSKAEIRKQVPVLASHKKIMIDNGNFYAIKNADYIYNIPTTVYANAQSDAYVAVPFVQLMLHGTYEYSTSAANTTSNITNAFLKAIEYGCIPSVSWYCSESDAKDKYYYNNSINDVVNLYLKANDIYNDLRGDRMTSHKEVKENCYCTEYNNSVKVYVNYSNNDISIGGITIPAKDALKVS